MFLYPFHVPVVLDFKLYTLIIDQEKKKYCIILLISNFIKHHLYKMCILFKFYKRIKCKNSNLIKKLRERIKKFYNKFKIYN